GPFGAATGASGGAASAGSETASPSATRQPVPPPVTEPGQPPRCEAQARKLDSKGAALVYEATARWQGTPADVFGFSPSGAPATSAPGRPTPTRVYVLARSDCHLLVFQSYAPCRRRPPRPTPAPPLPSPAGLRAPWPAAPPTP